MRIVGYWSIAVDGPWSVCTLPGNQLLSKRQPPVLPRLTRACIVDQVFQSSQERVSLVYELRASEGAAIDLRAPLSAAGQAPDDR